MHKMVLPTAMAKYKLEVMHSALSIIMFIKTIEMAIKPSQTKVMTILINP